MLFNKAVTSQSVKMVLLISFNSNSQKPQEDLNLLVTEEGYRALFYMPLYTSFTQFAECTSTDWK
jgi:hypothetical protein